MDQIKTGQFISELRKEQGMTQKDLAERLGVSDKAVSKWETGKGMPDASLFETICSTLDISITELLAGSKVSPEEYSKKAEENMMELAKENQKNKSGKANVIFGAIVLIIGIVFMIVSTSGVSGLLNLTWFIDTPTLLMIVFYGVAAVLLSGARGKLEVVKILRKVIIPFGVIMFIQGAIAIFNNIEDPKVIVPNVMVDIFSILYAVIIYIVLAIMEARMTRN